MRKKGENHLVWVKVPLVVTLLVLSQLSIAREERSFNGQLLDAGTETAAIKAYGKYKPSHFSADKKVVLVSWNSDEGKARFFRSKYNNDFFQLANNYQPQANPLYCGIASSVIVLNTIRASSGKIPVQLDASVKKPKALGGQVVPYNLYSQASLLNDTTDKVKPRQIIQLKNISPDDADSADKFDPGLKLEDLKGVLESYRLAVEKFPADADIESGAENFRKKLKAVLAEKQRFILINYKSDTVGQLGSGHISPVGAYDEQSDSVLVLDVAGYQNPWLWIPVSDLYASMHIKDGKEYRGYLVVSEGYASNK